MRMFMKKIIVIFIINSLILVMGCSEKTSNERLHKRNGLNYFQNETEPFTGVLKLYYPNGKPSEEVHFKYGKKDGLGIGWYENGQKQGEANFKDGETNGLTTMWYENGHKNAEAYFKDGKKDGLGITWYENGQKRSEGNYKNDKDNGLTTYWYENGQKRAEEYYEDGKIIDEKEYKKLESKESEVVNNNLVIDKSNTDNKFSFSSMLASLKSFFYKTLQSDAPADLHGTYSQKEFQNCCFEGEETTEKYHHLQLSPINVTGESDNSPEGEKVTITVDEVQISDIEGVKNGQVIDVHCDQLYFSPNAHYALSVYCSTPQKAEEQKEEQTNNESNFLSRESEKSYQKEGSEEVKNSTISKPPSQDEKVNLTQKIASVENDEKKLQGTTNNLSKSKFNSSSKLIRNMLNLAIDNGGINHESEIQEIISQITSSPKNQNGNKKLARDFNDKGHAFLKDEDFDSAVEMFEKAHQANPSDIEIANNLGFANMKADNLDAAEKYLIETLVLSPTRATAWANLGDLYALKDEESKAVACYANMYRFSKNRLNTDKFMRKLNESEYIESLKSARDKAIRSANSWFSF